MTRDYDFIGFTYGDKHSIDDFGIYRTSDGDRYNDNLIPPLTDKTADIPGNDGRYYFSSHYKPRQFSIPIAFDSLTEVQYQQVRKWLSGKEIKELIFDEYPYKVYSAKVTGTPQLKTICFEEGGERVYKGEGTIQFTCYYPYAHTPTYTRNGQDGRSLKNYSEDDYPTKGQWQDAASLLYEHFDGYNPGDTPANFIVRLAIPARKGDKLVVGELSVVINEELVDDLVWDSKTGLVTGYDENALFHVVNTSGKSYGGIPNENQGIGLYETYFDSVGYKRKFFLDGTYETYEYEMGNTEYPYISIEYNYWYY